MVLKVEEAIIPYTIGRITDNRGDLLDVNVWLALFIDKHPHHKAAKAYWDGEESANKLWFCRVTMLAFVRLLCQPALLAEEALKPQVAWDAYQRFVGLERVGLLPDPSATEKEFANLLSDPLLSHKHLTDAYLMALAKASGSRLVSFDKGFARWGQTNLLLLKPS